MVAVLPAPGLREYPVIIVIMVIIHQTAAIAEGGEASCATDAKDMPALWMIAPNAMAPDTNLPLTNSQSYTIPYSEFV